MKTLFSGKSKQERLPGYNNAALPGQHRTSSPSYNTNTEAQSSHSNSSNPNLQRTPSHRQPQPQPLNTQPLNRPPVDVATSVNSTTSTIRTVVDSRASEPNRTSAYIPPVSPLPQQSAEKEHKGLRARFGIGGHHAKQSIDQSSSGNRASGIGRRQSVKRKDPVDPEKFYSLAQGEPRPGYSRAPSSQQQLNTQAEEEEESQHNAYTQQQQVQQQQQQQYQGGEAAYSQQPQPPQAYYSDPRALQRVNTDQAYHQGGSIELLSPAEGQQHTQAEGVLPQDQYKAFNPDTDESPVLGQYQTTEDSTRYSYQQQQQQQQGQQQYQGRIPSGGQQPQSEPQYPPQQGRVSLDRYRQPELHHPQASRHHQQSASQDPLFLQPPRGTSLKSPPSPLLSADQQAYGHQTGQPQPPPSPYPPSTADSQHSSIDSMPSSHPQSRSTARTGDKGAPREGQQGNLPPTPGLQSFGSNVVPAGGQGQPYRGQGQGGRPDGESGRATPPPQISELPDEEAAAYMQLQREYKELREKYQKVKKYYFEKESQVHQLQNTLAHQRLSQSRTSLDDTEYATRFTRLDGLIAQLSYSIRKSWKTIPEFLHRAINKDALVTGKQEMTAVGRAYFSHWIFHNVFESLFHPDLEPGLSRDLKEVMVNIRRNCPPFQSGEEEEALTAKLINWRLTTLEGLQDRLKSAEAQQHRHRLVEKLNDKLVADISGLLVDPAPPDLNGGVQMILDLAINIAVHVPLESRDVVIEYFPPGYPIVPDVMKVEVGIPGLTNAILPTETSPADSTDRASLKSNDTKDSVTDPSEITGSKDEGRGGGKRGMFSGIIGGGGGGGGKVTKAAPPGQQPGSGPAGKGSQGSVGAPTSQGQGARETPSPKEERVRLAAFLAVQIRGRSVLVKAPVYTTPV